MYVGDWMDRGAVYWPARTAVVDHGRGARYTYEEMRGRALRLAWVLSRGGVGRGDRVALLCPNGVEYLDALFACARLGAVMVPYNFRLHPREVQDLSAQVAPRALVFAEEYRAAAAAARAGCPAPPLCLHTGGGGEGSPAYEEALAAAPAGALGELPDPGLKEEDIACLLFTGGTTGTPRAAQISYRMIAWNTLTTLVHELQRGDVTIVHTPMFHTGGLLVYTLPLLTLGGTVVIMRRWDAAEMLRLIEAEGATLFFCVPSQYRDLMAAPGFSAADLSRVRFVTSGGAPLPVPLVREFSAVHPVPFKQGFGMTEFGPGAFSMGPEHALDKAGSIGTPNMFVDACVVGEDGAPVPPGRPGELLLRGPACFSGYFGDPAATAAALDARGWLHTGDVARVDEDGFYYIIDRKKDMFISGGENVYPVEIERALHEHPAVQECAVIGVPDERWGQVGRAFVVLRPGCAASEDELLGFLRGRLARYKVPRSVVQRDRLPLTPAGKVLKRALQQG